MQEKKHEYQADNIEIKTMEIT